MMRTEEVKCDGCGADLTTRTNMTDYRLVLESESKPGYGSGAYTAMHISPPLDRAHHFCGLDCLDHWRGRRLHYQNLWGEHSAKWRKEHGTKMGDFVSYPIMPDDARRAKDAEFHAAALEAFPMKDDG